MNVIGIYPVSSQPPHLGHYKAYEFLKKITGVNTFVATSNKTELPQAPLNFQDKQQIWTRHGVPIDKIVQVKDPQKAVEITQKFGTDRTVAVFAMSKRDANAVLKSPSGYFLPFKGMAGQMEPLVKHAYVLIIPDELLYINKSFSSITIKQAFGSKRLSDEQKKSFFKQVFGWYDISLFELISKKFAEANTVKERVDESMFPILRRTLKPFIKEIIGQMVQPQGTDLTQTMPQPDASVTDPVDAAKAAKTAKDAKISASKQADLNATLAKKEQELNKKKDVAKVKQTQDAAKAAKTARVST